MKRTRFIVMLAAVLVVLGCAAAAGTSNAATGQTIFGTSTSGINTDPDTAKSVIGTQFRVAKAGTVDAVKVHRSAQITGALTGKVARGSTVLATVTLPAAGAGWQVVDLPAPVDVVTGQTYTVYYTAPAGRYSVKSQYTWPKVSGDLTAVKGVYTFGNGVPTSVYNNESYFVDVVFNPTVVVPPTTSASPSPSTTAEPSTTAPTTSEPTTEPTITAPTTTTTTPPTGCVGEPNTPGGADPWGGCWPGPHNTGFESAPGYPGSLTDFTGSLQSGQTYSFLRFPVGFTIPANISDVTFYGCRFDGADSSSWNVRVDGQNVTFDWSSFVPRDQAAPPVAHTGSSQFGIWQYYDNPGKMTVTNSDFWGWANGLMFYSRAGAEYTYTARNNWIHDARADGGGVDHTDGILQHAGVSQNLVIEHNTIISEGNTNGIALQEQEARDVTISKNLLSGFAYTVAIAKQSMTNVRFVDNVFSTAIRPNWGPLYSWVGGVGNEWRRNTWHVPAGAAWGNPADSGKFWLPSGDLSTTDYTGN